MSYHKNLNISKEFLIEQHINLGKTWNQIAIETKCSVQNLRYYFNKYNIKNQTSRVKNIINQKFGKLIVIELCQKRYKDKSAIWKCRCDCGNITFIKTSLLINNSIKSCGKCLIFKGTPHSFWQRIKRGANKRNIKYNLSKEYLWNLFIKQNQKCALSGIKLKIAKGSKKWWQRTTASLDRIDSSKDYIEGNVQWVYKDINFMKQSFSQEYFIKLCKKISDFNNK